MAPKINGRIAPTPSGYLHEGNLANFLLNAAMVGPGGDLLLRIDDLDRERCRPEYLKDIFRALQDIGIQPTSGPASVDDFHQNWSQVQRASLYQSALETLAQKQRVFACPCSRKDLAGGRHPYKCREGAIDLNTPGVTWRLITHQQHLWVSIPDQVTEGFTVDVAARMPELVVRTKAGRASYQLACTVDDEYFGITRVGRGQDLLGSTAAQSVLSDLLGYVPLFERIQFIHHPLLVGPGGEKLSKRAGRLRAPLEINAKLVGRLKELVASWLI